MLLRVRCVYGTLGNELLGAARTLSRPRFSNPSDLARKPFFAGLVKYFSSGPIVAMVWEGPDVILTGRKMLGATNPNSSEPGTAAAAYA